MKIKLLILLFLISSLALAQGEANIWYFGSNAGLDFNSGSPVALTNGQLDTKEGCATISNAAGQLLFYTDGSTVYNKNHQIMVNGLGLMGDNSTTQSATIVPKPGSTTIYYIFTIDVEAKPNGFRYSIVDITLENNLGAVTAEKNVLIYTPTCEKIGIIKHANTIDYWIVTHAFGSNIFYSHLLTNSGLSNLPTQSATGYAPLTATQSTGNNRTANGYMKIAPNGSKIAAAHGGNGWVSGVLELYDFNNVTGVVSNPRLLLTENGENYGVEFSPNSEVLYYSNLTNPKLYQFDLNAVNIANSKLLIFQGAAVDALQLGPDLKIYFAQIYLNKIGVINNPNQLGLGCNVVSNTIDLAGKICRLGLPAFNQSFFFSPAIQLENACVGQSTSFELNTNQIISSAVWNFGDGTSVNGINVNHTYSTSGTYQVSVVATSAIGTGTNSRTILISDVPTATAPTALKVCDVDADGFYNFDLSQQTSTILNGQLTSQYKVKYYASTADYTANNPISTPASYINVSSFQQQTIIAEVSNIVNSDCKAITSFIIQVYKMPVVPSSVTAIKICDNSSVGTDTDGKILFNLTQNASAILNGQLLSEFSMT